MLSLPALPVIPERKSWKSCPWRGMPDHGPGRHALETRLQILPQCGIFIIIVFPM
ncbi:hypothetical protein [Burkholderia sp.]|uniref:hypothetical protein n=1 Tax=Burkholderia sp. TaxID=36773 RepID=UPI0025BB4694|nr:hypothetical protein [Burkholderia sp.]